MLWDASALEGYAIKARDGRIGSVGEFLFEDTRWIVRWLVVDTGHWLAGRKVLLPPSALGEPDPSRLPARSGEEALVALVGELGVGDRDPCRGCRSAPGVPPPQWC